MKALLLIPMMLLSLTLWGQEEAGLQSYRAKFWKQIVHTCQGNLRFEKSVTEIAEDKPVPAQRKLFSVDCRNGSIREEGSEAAADLSTSEFEELFEYSFADPYVRDYLEVKRSANGVEASVLPDNSTDTPLHKQTFQVDPATGILRYAEIKVMKNNLLYDFELHTQVWFDEAGNYERHTTETYTRVVLSGSVHTIIEGKRLS